MNYAKLLRGRALGAKTARQVVGLGADAMDASYFLSRSKIGSAAPVARNGSAMMKAFSDAHMAKAIREQPGARRSMNWGQVRRR